MHDTPFRNFRKNQWKWPQANVNYTWYCFHLDTTVPFLSPEKHATWWNFSSKRLLWELHWLQQSSFFFSPWSCEVTWFRVGRICTSMESYSAWGPGRRWAPCGHEGVPVRAHLNAVPFPKGNEFSHSYQSSPVQ